MVSFTYSVRVVMCSYTEKEWRRDISVHARKHDLEMKVGFNDKNNDLDYI